MMLLEARAKPKTITALSMGSLGRAQQAALTRLQLYTIGRTHEILLDYGRMAGAILQEFAGADGKLDAGEAARAQVALLAVWEKTFMDSWMPLFQGLRREAASIPFGTLAAMHEKYISPQRTQISSLGEAKSSPVFEPQLAALIEAAAQMIYQDGLNLSSRIWRLDRETREGIHQVIMDAITNSRSAWETAKNLEKYLGASQDCPRWTSTRLYQLTKKQIAAGVRTGLKTGEECQGQGVAYKALRLARNEIQAVHHAASDRVMRAQPWVEKEQIILSPAHPVRDICDDVVGGGEGGQGIYPVGQIILPLHVQCLCFKVTIRQPEEEFIERLRGWMNGGNDPGMDGYAQFLGGSKMQVASASLLDDVVAKALGIWLWGSADDLKGRLQ